MSARQSNVDDKEAVSLLVVVVNVDLFTILCESLPYRAIMYLESTCSTFRSAIVPLWLSWLRSLGFADELEIPDRETVPSLARRIVVLESERRASFPRRLRSALVKLGLHAIQPAERTIGHLSTHPADQDTVREWEDSLRLLQYRHGFVLDRRYARALRALPFGPPPSSEFFDQHFCFYSDTLPGASKGHSDEAAAQRVANCTRRELCYPQRAAWLPADSPCLLTHQRGGGATRVGAATPRWRQTVAQEMKEMKLDAASKPQLEELLEGRDIELCAFAPLAEDEMWDGVFTPEVLMDMPHRFFDGPKLLLEDAPHRLLSYPKEARFNWQIHERGGGPQRYHRMALYTTTWSTADPSGRSETTLQPRMRTCTPAERLVCAHLAEHGLQPRQSHLGKMVMPTPALQAERVGAEQRASGGSSMPTPTSMVEEEENSEARLLASRMSAMGLGISAGNPLNGSE